jgi:aryl-alcohol dehydrogenase-like predicted oxidoreductase
LSQNLALVDGLRAVAERLSCSLPELAVAWTLAWSGVSGAIVGARNPEQVDGWVGAAAVDVADKDLDDIARLLEETGAGSGPTRPTRP